MVAGYVRAYANFGSGPLKVMDEAWYKSNTGRTGSEDPWISDEELVSEYLNPEGFLALSDNLVVASDCFTTTQLGSLTVYHSSMSEDALEALAGPPLSPSSFLLEVSPPVLELDLIA